MYLWIILLFSMLLLPITHYTFVLFNNTVSEKKQRNGKILYIILFSVILILLTGLRADTVGKDTAMYHQLYDITRATTSFSEALGLWQNKSIEIGYLFLEFILGRVMDFHCASLIFAIISIVPVMILIYRYSDNYWFSLFIYLAFGMYVFSFAGVRQAIAMGICCIAFIFAIEKDFIKYVVAIIIAISIHKSAIIFFPVYWLIRIKHNKRSIIWFFAGIVMSFGFRTALFKILNMFSRYTYETSDNAGGLKLYFFILGSLILSYFFSQYFFPSKKLDDNTKLVLNDDVSIFNMVAFCALLWPITSSNAVVFRLYYYYFLFLILFIPNFIKAVPDKKNKLIIGSLYLLVGAYYLHFYTLGNAQMMYSTYCFYWQ